jgi:hypothetical protein
MVNEIGRMLKLRAAERQPWPVPELFIDECRVDL